MLGLPFAGEWTEVINTDAEIYGGSGVGNLGTVTAHESPHSGQPASVATARSSARHALATSSASA